MNTEEGDMNQDLVFDPILIRALIRSAYVRNHNDDEKMATL